MEFLNLLTKVDGNWDLAIDLFKSAHGRTPNFDEYEDVSIHNMINGNVYLRNRAYDEQVKLPKTFDQWHSVYCISTQRDDLELLVKSLEKMTDLAKEFYEGLIVFDCLEGLDCRVTSLDNWKKQLMSKVLAFMKTKGTASDWIQAIGRGKRSDYQLKSECHDIIIQKAVSFYDWLWVFWNGRGDNRIYEKALENMVHTAVTLEQWQKLYDLADKNSIYRARAASEIAKLI